MPSVQKRSSVVLRSLVNRLAAILIEKVKRLTQTGNQRPLVPGVLVFLCHGVVGSVRLVAAVARVTVCRALVAQPHRPFTASFCGLLLSIRLARTAKNSNRHEITHGFDNSGRHFNGTGAFVDWWTNASTVAFQSRAQCLVDQYDGYVLWDGETHVNGANTLGENIADNGGINLAFKAYKAQHDKPPVLLPGLTNDQLFFVYYAQEWCTRASRRAVCEQVEGDVHSPAQFRVDGPLRNYEPFADAFQCTADDPMGASLTPDGCEVW